MSEIEAVFAPIIAAAGAIIVKIVEKILDRKVKSATNAWDKLRIEQKKEIERLQDDNVKLRKEIEKCRAKRVKDLEEEVGELRQHIEHLTSDDVESDKNE